MPKVFTAAETEKYNARKAARATMLAKCKAQETKTVAGYQSITGHVYSGRNSMYLAMQNVQFGTLAGFRQWLKAGRAVRKGEHGADIMIPLAGKKAEDGTQDDVTRFGWSSVFHISQTEPLNQL